MPISHRVLAKAFSDQSVHNIKAVSVKEGTASALTDVDGGGSTSGKHNQREHHIIEIVS